MTSRHDQTRPSAAATDTSVPGARTKYSLQPASYRVKMLFKLVDPADAQLSSSRSTRSAFRQCGLWFDLRMCELVLIRPGASVYDEQNRLQGILDIPLSERGHGEVTRMVPMLARTLDGASLSALYCGPGENVVRTAEIVGKGLGSVPSESRNSATSTRVYGKASRSTRSSGETPSFSGSGSKIPRRFVRRRARRSNARWGGSRPPSGPCSGGIMTRRSGWLWPSPWPGWSPVTCARAARPTRRAMVVRRFRAHRDRPDALAKRDRLRDHCDGSAGRTSAERLARALRRQASARRRLDALRGMPGDALSQAGRAKPRRLPRVQPPLPALRPRTDRPTCSTRTRSRNGSRASSRSIPWVSTTAGPIPSGSRPSKQRTGLDEAAVVGQGFIKGIRIVLGVTDSGFIMGSMGSVVGEKLTRAIEEATRQKLPLVIVSGSGGGARMHEGIFSLMQMAKVSTALGRFHAAGGLYISVLTHPTMGGVAASFASLGDFILAEPKALIGFAGPRVIEQTVRVQLPRAFRRANSSGARLHRPHRAPTRPAKHDHPAHRLRHAVMTPASPSPSAPRPPSPPSALRPRPPPSEYIVNTGQTRSLEI